MSLRQKPKHQCKSFGIERESPVKCVCGSSTICKVLTEQDLWRYWDMPKKPHYAWFCKVTNINIEYCSLNVCHTMLIGRYEHYYQECKKNLEAMWELLQHFSGIDGR